MNTKIGNCVIKTDANNWMVEVYGESKKLDETRKPTGEVEIIKKETLFPASFTQALYIVLNQKLKESTAKDVRELLDSLKEARKEIREVANGL